MGTSLLSTLGGNMTDPTNNGNNDGINPGDYGATPPPPPPPPMPPTPPMPPMNPNYQGGGYNQGPKNEPFAITSMVTGIVGGVTICCWPLAAILAIVATVFGALSLVKFKNSPNGIKGKGMAIAGLVLGIVVIALIVGGLLLSLLTDSTTWDYQYDFE